MKTLVLLWTLFQMFSFTASDTNNTTEWYTFINSTNLAKPGCESRCGDLVVPYPFGIGDNPECYIEKRFRIYCNTSVNPPKATISEGGYRSIKLISDSTIRLSNIVLSLCNSPNERTDFRYIVGFGVGPYSFSQVNKFTVIGCDRPAILASTRKSGIGVSTGCMVFCLTRQEVVADECTGSGCCQSSIPHSLHSYSTQIGNTIIGTYTNTTSNTSLFPCTHTFVGEENAFKFKGLDDLNDPNLKKRIEDTVPIVIEWAIGNLSCSEAEATDDFACQSNSKCVSSTRESGGYRCVCKEGYEGNPYLPPGCQDINECVRREDFPCYGTCINTIGNYKCKCKKGYIGDGKILNDCRRKPFKVLGLLIGIYYVVPLNPKNRYLK